MINAYRADLEAIGATGFSVPRCPTDQPTAFVQFPTGADVQLADSLVADTVDGVKLVFNGKTGAGVAKTPPLATAVGELARKLPGVTNTYVIGGNDPTRPVGTVDANLAIFTKDQETVAHLRPFVAEKVTDGMRYADTIVEHELTYKLPAPGEPQ